MILNQKETKDLAEKLAKSAKLGNVFGIKGTLGSGKTFFSNCFINALLENKKEILSPTFNIVYSYQTNIGEVFHFDLYRIKNFEELENIGFFDYLKNGICLIEWPEIAENFLKKALKQNYTQIEIKIKDNNTREIIISNSN